MLGFHLTLQTVLEIASRDGYLILALIAIPEGPIVAMVSGYFVAIHIFNPVLAFLALMIGDFIGDSVYYLFGYLSRRRDKIPKFLSYLKITEERILKAEEIFSRHGIKLLLFGKTQPIGSAILFLAGFSRMPYLQFITVNMLATIPKMIILEYLGYALSASYKKFDTYIYDLGLSFLLVGLFLCLFFYIRKKYKYSID